MIAALLILLPIKTHAQGTPVQNSYSIFVSNTCPGQLSCQTFDVQAVTQSVLRVKYTAGAGHCSSLSMRISVDGVQVAVSGPLAAGQSSANYDFGPVSSGSHLVSLRAEGILGGCNTGNLINWAGSVEITTSVQQASITVSAVPTHGGTVTGGGTYTVGSQVSISATPAPNWAFSGWNDGIITNPRTVTVPAGGANYTANFQSSSVITVVANPLEGGVVAGGGTFQIGSQQQISASPSQFWIFEGWSDGSTAISRTITVPPNGASYTANFSKICKPQRVEFIFSDLTQPGETKRLEYLEAKSGERIEVWQVAENFTHLTTHYELRYYVPGAGHALRDGRIIGACHFVAGRNILYVTFCGEDRNYPDRFERFEWVNIDFDGDDWKPFPNGLLDIRTYYYDVRLDYLSAVLRQYNYPPGCYPLTDEECLGRLGKPVYEYVETNPPLAAAASGGLDQSFFDALTANLDAMGVPDEQLGMKAIRIAPSDIDMTGAVDSGDFQIAALGLGSCRGDANYNSVLDLDRDGCVTFADLQLQFSEDSDGDGATDFDEFIAGTVPNDVSSRLTVSVSRESSTDNPVIQWPSVAGRIYRVQWTTQLSAGWMGDVASGIFGSPPLNSISDPVNHGSGNMFYRVEVQYPVSP